MSHWEPMTTLTPLRPGEPLPAAASPADLVLRHGAQSGRLIHVEYMAGRAGRPRTPVAPGNRPAAGNVTHRTRSADGRAAPGELSGAPATAKCDADHIYTSN